MQAILAHRIELRPNRRQAEFFGKAVGVSRFAYNWALEQWQRWYKEHQQDPSRPKPNEWALKREFNRIKREQFPWVLEVPKSVPEQAIMDLGKAFKRFFQRKSKYPTFRKKGRNDSACMASWSRAFKVEGNRIRLPKIGWVRMRESLRFQGTLMSAVISHQAGRWYVSIRVQLEWQPPVRESQADEAVGVDLGIKDEVTLSTGEKFSGPKPLRRLLRLLRRRSRQHSRKRKGSQNRRKSALRLARLHRRISNIRKDWTHKLTTMLVRRFSVIVIEDLNVREMQQNRRLSRALIDSMLGEIRRQLEYKCRLYGCRLIVADKWYPSSKMCSICGAINADLALSNRVWTCACGAVHDRDVNAAVNLLRFGLASLNSPTEGYSGSHACGDRQRPVVEAGTVEWKEFP